MRRALALLALLGLAACSAASPATRTADGRLKVVAIENVWGDIAATIGGSHVQVSSILTDPTVDPHTYETDPKSAAAVSSAAFVIENGLGYDAFANKLLSASKVKGRAVLNVASALGVKGDDVNPHLWYSPTKVIEAAIIIEAQLVKNDATHADGYRAGLVAFEKDYQQYGDVLDKIRAKYKGTKIAYTERVPGYLVEAAGLVVGTPASFSQAVEDGNAPGAGDVDAVDRALAGKTVKLLLYNAQVTSPVTDKVKKLATAEGVPVVGVTETLPAGRSFSQWQTEQAQAVLAALGG